MARTFDNVDDIIRWSIGGLSGTTANCTIVTVLRRATDTTMNTVLALHATGPTALQWLQIEDGDNLQLGNTAGASTSPFTVTSADGWVLVSARKASGTVAPRFSKYVYSSGTWTHGDYGGTLADGTAPGAGGDAAVAWQTGDLYSGDIAAIGVWSGVKLADDQVERLAYSLTQWYALAPTAMWVLDQSATTQNVPDVTGNGANQSSLTGTSVATSSVPVLGYGADVTTVTVTAAAPTLSTPPDLLNRRRRHALLVR